MPKKEKLIKVDKTGMPTNAIKLPDQQLRFNGVYIDPRLQKPKNQMPFRDKLEQAYGPERCSKKLGYCFCPACQWNREALNEACIAQRAAQKKSGSSGRPTEARSCLENSAY